MAEFVEGPGSDFLPGTNQNDTGDFPFAAPVRW